MGFLGVHTQVKCFYFSPRDTQLLGITGKFYVTSPSAEPPSQVLTYALGKTEVPELGGQNQARDRAQFSQKVEHIYHRGDF